MHLLFLKQITNDTFFSLPKNRRLNTSATSISSIKEEQHQQPPSTSQPMNFQTSPQIQKPPNKSLTSKSGMSSKDIKHEEKEYKVKQEGQKPTSETQGPPLPPTNQYYLPYIGPGGGNPFFPDPSHSLYRNMLVPPYNTPYHLPMARFPTPEDLSRNTKALDLLQQHASQYYNTHKIHELSDRVNLLKSPTSNTKIPSSVIPSPNMNPPANSMAGNSSLPTSNINNSLDVNNVNSNEKLMSNNNDDNMNEDDDKKNNSSNINGDDEDNLIKSDQQNESKINENDRTNSSPSNHSNPNMSQMSASKLAAERNDRIDASNNLNRTNSSPSTQRYESFFRASVLHT